MSEVTTEQVETTTETTETTDDQRVPYERFEKVNKQAKEAKEAAAAAKREAEELRARLDARESEGLPELERERKAREALEKRLADAEEAREQATKQVTLANAKSLVTAAARDFHDPDDAVRFVNLDEIETAEDAERAVKRVAKAKKHLLKDEDAKIPGKVLKDGRAVERDRPADPLRAADEEAAIAMRDEINRMRAASGFTPGGLLGG